MTGYWHFSDIPLMVTINRSIDQSFGLPSSLISTLKLYSRRGIGYVKNINSLLYFLETRILTFVMKKELRRRWGIKNVKNEREREILINISFRLPFAHTFNLFDIYAHYITNRMLIRFSFSTVPARSELFFCESFAPPIDRTLHEN